MKSDMLIAICGLIGGFWLVAHTYFKERKILMLRKSFLFPLEEFKFIIFKLEGMERCVQLTNALEKYKKQISKAAINFDIKEPWFTTTRNNLYELSRGYYYEALMLNRKNNTRGDIYGLLIKANQDFLKFPIAKK